MKLYADALHDEFARWALSFITAGGADLGEILAIADQNEEPSDDKYFQLWDAAARRHHDIADEAAAAGHPATARAHYLRTACFLTVAYHPLYGTPVDPRLADAFERQTIAFDRAMSLRTPPAEPMSIPFEGNEMLGYFVPAADAQEGERRPLVIATNGYDATISDMYFGTAQYAVQRGNHCLLFDGPGQGAIANSSTVHFSTSASSTGSMTLSNDHLDRKTSTSMYPPSNAGEKSPPRPPATERVAGLMIYLPVAGFAVDLAIRLAGGVDDWKSAALETALLWLVGVNGFILASGHLLQPARVAARIRWPTSPFQFEVGLTNLLLAALGLVSGWFDRDFWLATIIAFSIYMLGAAAGHVRSMIQERNYAPGNAGYVFWYDLLAPILLIVLYVESG